MEYEVVFSMRAGQHMREIIESSRGRYTPQQTLDYLDAIEARCGGLGHMPQRFGAVVINGLQFRRMNHKAHAILYRIIEEDRRVVIEAVLRGSRDFRRHL